MILKILFQFKFWTRQIHCGGSGRDKTREHGDQDIVSVSINVERCCSMFLQASRSAGDKCAQQIQELAEVTRFLLVTNIFHYECLELKLIIFTTNLRVSLE